MVEEYTHLNKTRIFVVFVWTNSKLPKFKDIHCENKFAGKNQKSQMVLGSWLKEIQIFKGVKSIGW